MSAVTGTDNGLSMQAVLVAIVTGVADVFRSRRALQVEVLAGFWIRQLQGFMGFLCALRCGGPFDSVNSDRTIEALERHVSQIFEGFPTYTYPALLRPERREDEMAQDVFERLRGIRRG